MASEDELVKRLRDILRSSDLATTTAAIVRRKLEADFGVDLSEKKAFIREQIDIFLGELSEIEVEGKAESGEREEVKPTEEEEGGSGGGDEDEEEEGDEEDEVEEKESPVNAGGGSRKRSSNKPIAEVKKRGSGFTKLCSLSPQLQEFVNAPELARTEVVKRLWTYIRENNLQNPSDKRKIICDEKLLSLFKVKTIDMFQMTKSLSKHIWPLSSENGPLESAPREKPQKKVKDDKDDTSRKGKRQKEDFSEREDIDATPGKGKRQKGGNSGFLVPLPLSDALTKFIGTGETELSRSDVIKRLWDYIKGNNLQLELTTETVIVMTRTPRTSTATTSGRTRPRVTHMSSPERSIFRAQNRSRTQRRRTRMTDEQHQRERERNRIRMQQRRANMTDEQRSRERQTNRERARQRRSLDTTTSSQRHHAREAVIPSGSCG